MTEHERIELNKTLPKKMLIRDSEEEKWVEGIVLYILPGNAIFPVVIVNSYDEKSFKDGNKYYVGVYRYYKEIPQVEEMTLEQVCKELGREIKIIK